ncbi:MAG: hypothetical protein ACXW3C_06490 [Pyrinomonadaceae bacterium]
MNKHRAGWYDHNVGWVVDARDNTCSARTLEKADFYKGQIEYRPKDLNTMSLSLIFSPRAPSKAKLPGEFRTENGKDVVIPAPHVAQTCG